MSFVVLSIHRTHGAGLKYSAVYVNDEKLTFENDKALIDVASAGHIEFYWRILGEPGSEFTLDVERKDSDKKGQIKDLIPGDKSRTTGFQVLDLEATK